jgi:hypothetical protein
MQGLNAIQRLPRRRKPGIRRGMANIGALPVIELSHDLCRQVMAIQSRQPLTCLNFDLVIAHRNGPSG